MTARLYFADKDFPPMAPRQSASSKPARVYKVCTAGEWRAALARGVYDGSADDLRDGYVHLSTASQLPGVLARYFADKPDLVAVSFDVAALGRALRWETARSGDAFPHFYGALAAAHAVAVQAVPDDEAGRRALIGALV